VAERLTARGRRPLVISHAACKGHAPENTLAGIRAALDFGSDAIEIDLHCTADGTPVLLHDDTVDRTTDGAGDVRTLTLAQVQRLDAGAQGFEGRFAGERVPTLHEVLRLTLGQALLVMEIKQARIEEAVLGVVRELNAAEHVMVWSFQPAVVARMRALAPEIPCSLLWSERNPNAQELLAAALAGNAQAVSPQHSLIDEQLMTRALRRGLAVYAWTVDEAADIGRVAALGVDGICSNFPDRVRALT
jgi:glycerophosphoryl diester phosphodiesterase